MRATLILMSATLSLAACGEAQAPDGGDPAPPMANPAPAAFAQCAICHSVAPGQNGIGPSLAGVYGAPAGHVGSYAYSSAMRESGIVWDEAALDRYLADPRGTVPGTKMSYPGLRDEEQRAELIEWLKTL